MTFQGSNRFNPTGGSGIRNNAADFSASASPDQRGGNGSDGQTPHSSAGFRHALMKTARSGNRLKDQLPNKTTFGGKGFKKPNYFSQGGQRHGMHIGAGAPFTGPAAGDAGASFGE
jgi:hypothetical protein